MPGAGDETGRSGCRAAAGRSQQICCASTDLAYRILREIANPGPRGTTAPAPSSLCRGHAQPAARHFVLDAPLQGPFPDDTEQAMFGLGCFWGAERKFWQTEGVYTTAAGLRRRPYPGPDATKRSAPARRDTTKSSWSCIDPRSSATTSSSRSSGKATTRPRACGRATTGGRSTAPGSITSMTRSTNSRHNRCNATRRAAARGVRPDHDRESSRPRPSTTPRTTISSTSRRTQRGYCGLGGTGVGLPYRRSERRPASETKIRFSPVYLCIVGRVFG